MPSATSSFVRGAVVLGGLVVLNAAIAGDRNGDRRPTSSFGLVTSSTTARPPTPQPASNGAGVAPARPVVSNPYQVPLLQNAGTLRGVR